MRIKKNLFIAVVLTLFTASISYAQKTIITKEQLPQQAQTFVNSYFSNQPLSYIMKDFDDYSVEYDVHFNNGMEIEFNSKGDWKEVNGEYQAIPTGFIPKKIVNYVSAQFPGTTITKIEKNPFKYEVKLANGLELDFNTSGDFVRIDD